MAPPHWALSTRLCCSATDDKGKLIAEKTCEVEVGADSAVRVCDFCFDIEAGQKYRVTLALSGKAGNTIAKNIYDDAFNHPPHPKGQPGNASHNFGMRLYKA